jgi:hypothetical protein
MQFMYARARQNGSSPSDVQADGIVHQTPFEVNAAQVLAL